jgi:chromosome segregation ATPase
MTIALEDVRDAVGRLKAASEKPTNQNVRKILGRGSFEQIAPLVRRALDEDAQAEAALRQAPAALRGRFEGCLASLWGVAQKIAREEAEHIRSGAEADAKEALGKLEASAAEAEALKAKLLEATLRLTDRAAELESARGGERAALLSATDATRRAAGLETGLRAAKAHIEELEGQIRENNQRIDALIKALPIPPGGRGRGAPAEPFAPILP